MTTSFEYRGVRRVRGLTLIELMVSITIGLVLMIAISSAYIGSSGASRMAEAQGHMNEDAQAALSILAQQIRMAGDNPRQPDYADADRRNPVFNASTYIIRGCDGPFTAGSPDTIANLSCAAGTNSLPDSIAISYEADTSNTIPTSGGLATDCLGNGLTAVTGTVNKWNGASTVSTSVTYTVADNRFYIATPTSSTTPNLYCKGSGGSAQPLVENIEDMQFFYGTGPATGTLTMAGFLDANGVETDANLAALADSPSRWARVVTVRICVLARSALPMVSDSASAQYYKCDGSLETSPPDLRLRRAYFSTVVMRNRVPPTN